MISYVGIDRATNKRVWGYCPNKNSGIYIFWGPASGNLRIVRSVSDSTFYHNLRKKKNRYTQIDNKEFINNIENQILQFVLFNKLKK